jgi:hypothetical protein
VAREAVRAVVLCEDQRHRAFALRLLERLGVTPISVVVAPKGAGSAEQWVREQYPKEAKAHRSRAGAQPNLILVVMTDGDRFGVAARKASLDDRLGKDEQPRRGPTERIACLIPTWSIETWLAWLCQAENELAGFSEATSFKNDGTFERLWAKKAISARLAIEGWAQLRHDEAARIPSLEDARTELRRVP